MASEGQQRSVVLMQAPILPGLVEQVEERYHVIRMWEDLGGAALREAASSIRALVSQKAVPRELLDLLPGLRLISNFGVGVDHIDLDYCRRRGICVTNTPDVLTDDVADLAILLMLAALRRLCPADRFVRDGLWPVRPFPLAKKASGLRVGIVGLGRIGMAIARRSEGFDCIISYYGRAEKPGVSYVYYPKLLDLAANSDVLVISCPLSKDTTRIIGREVLDALGPEGTIINIARGSVVDELELVKALLEKRVGAAGLDVFENEPIVPSELLNMDNVVLSPHAGTATWETRKAMAKLVLDNLDAFFVGKPLLSPVV